MIGRFKEANSGGNATAESRFWSFVGIVIIIAVIGGAAMWLVMPR
jgi:hypothetical protein